MTRAGQKKSKSKKKDSDEDDEDDEEDEEEEEEDENDEDGQDEQDEDGDEEDKGAEGAEDIDIEDENDETPLQADDQDSPNRGVDGLIIDAIGQGGFVMGEDGIFVDQADESLIGGEETPPADDGGNMDMGSKEPTEDGENAAPTATEGDDESTLEGGKDHTEDDEGPSQNGDNDLSIATSDGGESQTTTPTTILGSGTSSAASVLPIRTFGALLIATLVCGLRVF
eukprot:CAMPEP_0194067306 /NCGR_PEP_ID=MMETSP0009_2-20130614/86486_1 /TAXON_ID=210454 /ORGANISM="Grammatophora oceanica, Strain CCMP 410" /LENGTH=225 /DNA_ID=CAMNT_0038720321 /DNA_START=223 /DNA_END=900 /DNA_ORIENTATION=+